MKTQAGKKPVRRAVWKHIYINLVEVEFIFGLFAAYWLGAGSYWRTGLFVVISLVLGYVTSYLYWHLIDTSNGRDEPERVDSPAESRQRASEEAPELKQAATPARTSTTLARNI